MQIIAGTFKNRPITTPKGLKTRPTSGRLRETLFNICQNDIDSAHFLDLFAGSGAMGLEAISRGAASSTLVDNSKESIRCIQNNARILQVESHTDIIYGDVFEVLVKLAKRGKVYDIIYADPPYDTIQKDDTEEHSYSAQVLKFIDGHNHLLKAGGSLFLEDAVTALPENETLHNLTLKSSRRMGRSSLQHYIVKDVS